MGPDDCEDCCVVCCCSTLGYVCCCRPMEKGTRVKILWAWLLIVAAACAGVLGGLVYVPSPQIAGPGDIVPVRDHVHYLFCEQVLIKSDDLHLSGYLVYGDLHADNSRKVKTTKSTALFVDEKAYNYFAFYLLAGSEIFVKHCAKEFITFYLIAGENNFERWKEYRYCDNCYVAKDFLRSQPSCVKQDEYNSFRTDISEENVYFLIYSNDNYFDSFVDIYIEMNRRIYDLTNSTTACVDTTNCEIPLDGPDQTAVFWVMDYGYDIGIYNHQQFAVKCIPRIWVYLLLFGLPVLLIGVTLSVIIHRHCRGHNEELNNNSERSPLLFRATLPPSYSAVFSQPPKYEDIMRTSDPPPYYQYFQSIPNDISQSEGAYGVQTVENNQSIPNDNMHTEGASGVQTENLDAENLQSENVSPENKVTGNDHAGVTCDAVKLADCDNTCVVTEHEQLVSPVVFVVGDIDS